MKQGAICLKNEYRTTPALICPSVTTGSVAVSGVWTAIKHSFHAALQGQLFSYFLISCASHVNLARFSFRTKILASIHRDPSVGAPARTPIRPIRRRSLDDFGRTGNFNPWPDLCRGILTPDPWSHDRLLRSARVCVEVECNCCPLANMDSHALSDSEMGVKSDAMAPTGPGDSQLLGKSRRASVGPRRSVAC